MQLQPHMRESCPHCEMALILRLVRRSFIRLQARRPLNSGNGAKRMRYRSALSQQAHEEIMTVAFSAQFKYCGNLPISGS